MTLVSVIIPIYNRKHLIDQTIEGVLAQTFTDYEIIVVDDGSSDGTADYVEAKYPQVRLIRQANAGVSAARNTGIRAAKGELIALLDSDDLWLPQKLQLQVDDLRAQMTQAAVQRADAFDVVVYNGRLQEFYERRLSSIKRQEDR